MFSPPSPTNLFCALRRVFVVSLVIFPIAGGCVTPKAPPPPPPHAAATPPRPQAPAHPLTGERPGFLRLGNMAEGRVPVRVGLLLPFSNGSSATRGLAQSMMKAAQLALFDAHNADLVLMSADEGSTPSQAAAGARLLLGEGAEIIVGPLFAGSVTAVAPIARDHGVPVVSFSSDRSVAGNGVYLLSFQPENEVDRIVTYAAAQGHAVFAAMVPNTAYGARVAQEFASDVKAAGAQVADVEKFEPNSQGISVASKAVAGAKPDAILIAQGGSLLREIGPTLAADGASNQTAQYLGTGLWDDPANAREPMLAGGWFTAPAHASHKSFEARYRAVFGGNPSQLSTLAYDAVSLVALLAPGQPYHRFTQAALTDPNGFAGVDGIFRFAPDGSSQRGLAILRVDPEGFQIVSPAPKTFEGS